MFATSVGALPSSLLSDRSSVRSAPRLPNSGGSTPLPDSLGSRARRKSLFGSTSPTTRPLSTVILCHMCSGSVSHPALLVQLCPLVALYSATSASESAFCAHSGAAIRQAQASAAATRVSAHFQNLSAAVSMLKRPIAQAWKAPAAQSAGLARRAFSQQGGAAYAEACMHLPVPIQPQVLPAHKASNCAGAGAVASVQRCASSAPRT